MNGIVDEQPTMISYDELHSLGGKFALLRIRYTRQELKDLSSIHYSVSYAVEGKFFAEVQIDA